MKQDIHPTYYEKATVKCACGATHTIGSTKEKMTVEICSECHPFYTGKEKLVDTAGRVEKFKTRQKTAVTKKVPNSSKSSKGDLGKKSRILDSSIRNAQDESGQKKPKKTPKSSKTTTGQAATKKAVTKKAPAKKPAKKKS